MVEPFEYLFLPNQQGFPPVGWTYIIETAAGVPYKDQEGNQLVVQSTNLLDLLMRVREAHERLNINIDPTKLNGIVQTQICKRSFPPGGRDCMRADGSWVQEAGLNMSLEQVWQGTKKITKNRLKALLGALTGQSATVPQDEAERRAAICKACPKNIQVTDTCTACWTKAVAQFMHPELKTSVDADLYNCGVCACFCKVIVHYPLSDLETETELQPKLPANCWRKI